MSSLEKPQLVPARAFRMRREPVAFVAMALAWENVKCVSLVTPRILGVLSRGMTPLQIVAAGWDQDWWVSGVKSVTRTCQEPRPVSW
jgi:hypothetical protein